MVGMPPVPLHLYHYGGDRDGCPQECPQRPGRAAGVADGTMSRCLVECHVVVGTSPALRIRVAKWRAATALHLGLRRGLRLPLRPCAPGPPLASLALGDT